MKTIVKKKIIKCPHCETQFNYYESEFRPFCSERCKMIDLGHWLSEDYTIPVAGATIEEDEDEDLS